MRVLFWGTPGFALPTLRALLGEGHDVVGVVTQPDRPAGRGREMRPSLVKRFALEEKIPVLQPVKPAGPEFLAEIAALDPEISIVVAYGQILRTDVLDAPPLGSLNVHASLLPALRGAAPINWAIKNGDTMTGVSIMRMVKELDAGPVLHAVEEPIADDETGEDLANRLSEIGAEALIETLAMIELDSIEDLAKLQDDARATYAPKLTRENAHIAWTDSAVEVGRHVRAMDEMPGAWTTWNGEDIKLYRPLPEPERKHDAAPGTVLAESKARADDGILVACGSGAIRIREVKVSGKRRMTAAEWIRGRGAKPGDVFK